MDSDNFYFVALVALATFIAGVAFGVTVSSDAGAERCVKTGTVMLAGKAFNCVERK